MKRILTFLFSFEFMLGILAGGIIRDQIQRRYELREIEIRIKSVEPRIERIGYTVINADSVELSDGRRVKYNRKQNWIPFDSENL